MLLKYIYIFFALSNVQFVYWKFLMKLLKSVSNKARVKVRFSWDLTLNFNRECLIA